MDMRDRIVARWMQAGDVVPFGRSPRGPTIEIGAKHYVLSNDGGPLGSPDEPLEEGFGARVIRGPGHGKFKYLWVYDTDHQTLDMWRVTDGNSKVSSSARSEMARIVRLDKKGQMNRVTGVELRKIESAMLQREAENTKALQKWVESEKTNFQREVDARTQEFFDKHVQPLVDRVVSDIDAGATPLGFKPHSPDRPIRRQMLAFWIGRVITKEFTVEKVEQYLKRHGLDVEAPYHDIQAAHWAVGDVLDKMWEQYL